MTLELKEEKLPCVKCGKVGIHKPIEKLPTGGIKVQVIHNDGTICELKEYPDLNEMLPKSKRGKKVHKPKYIQCPICKTDGLLNHYNKHGDSHTIIYRIIHSKQKTGEFYKNGQPKPLVHMIKTQVERDNVLQQLGLYIPQNQEHQIKRGRGRPPKPEPEEIEESIDQKFINLIRNEMSEHKLKRKTLVLQYGQALEKEGNIPLEEINDHMTKKLKGLVSARYVRKILPDKYKNPDKADNARGTSAATVKKRKWNIERADKLSKKQLIEIFRAARDKWGKPFDQLANKTLQELK